MLRSTFTRSRAHIVRQLNQPVCSSTAMSSRMEGRFVSSGPGKSEPEMELGNFEPLDPNKPMKMPGFMKEELSNMGSDVSGIQAADEDDSAEPKETSEVKSMKPTGAGEKMTFQAETRRILDIVANSLYMDKEVFLRELISNASDALEKARHSQTKGDQLVDPERPLEVRIYTDDVNHTLTIQDYGIGMTREEMVSNLGTIARSGTKAFSENLREQESSDSNMIGQFGVGFYSSFMISDKVEVYSRSANQPDAPAHYWVSDGTGEFEIAEAEDVPRGTKVIVHLKETDHDFAVNSIVEGIIKKYSNFVGFNIYLNDEQLNTQSAIWLENPSAVTAEDHTEFYRYLSNAFDDPHYTMHFKTDAPIDVNALFYFPESHAEQFGMGRVQHGVSLYCRKVLIQPKCELVLPEWLRFIRGVVDSEDIPLNISRENLQDSALLNRLKDILQRRVLKFLHDKANKDPEKYLEWYGKFGQFIKEGAAVEYQRREELVRLLRFSSSKSRDNKYSLDDYIARMPMDQQDIFYHVATSYEEAIHSPYYESFENGSAEVLFLLEASDEFVLRQVQTYNKRNFVAIHSSQARAPRGDDAKKDSSRVEDKEFEGGLCDFIKATLDKRVSSVKISTKIRSSPAVIVDHETAHVRQVMKMMNKNREEPITPAQKLEVNPDHPIMRKLYGLRHSNPTLAKDVLDQVFDNALLAADLMDNPRVMLKRVNTLMEAALSTQVPEDVSEEVSEAEILDVPSK